jgi:N-acetylglucosaminyl-diphospho-decaprenol L-rhamnosyltransferase
VPAASVLCFDVVIVAHNAGSLLAESVGSAVGQAGARRVWVMDAASTDSSVDALRERAGEINIVPVQNKGFAAANNRGLESTDSPFVLLLNPDAVLRSGAIDALVATAKANPRAGIVGSLILNADGSVQANSFGRFPTLAGALELRVWRSVQRLRGNSNLSPKAPTATARVDWVSGAAMLVRRAAVEDAGPMDESFFLYYEDTEWCHRMRDRGWEVLLEPKAQTVHHLAGSAVPKDAVASAYRASFYRYCDLYGLWGLKTSARLGLALRRVLGGAP